MVSRGKFKLFRKIFKKFKIILNINYLKLNINLKTSLKSILSQSGILDALVAEERVELLLEIFFYDLYGILIKVDGFKNEKLLKEIFFFNNASVLDKNKDFRQFLQHTFLFEEFIDNLHDLAKNFMINFKKYRAQISKKKSARLKNNKLTVDNEIGYVSEFRFFNLQLPLHIYIYKRESKNLFLVCNLISTLLLKKLFLSLWRRRKRNYKKIKELLFVYNWKGLKKKILFKEAKLFFFTKFDFAILSVKIFFKLALLRNFKYIYYNFFDYAALKISMISLFGNFLSFYRYPEFKRRKINFRRKIRKNMFLENQYI